MADFTGILTIISNQSSLNGDLLLMDGISDAAQAMFAATQFLVKTKHLHSGQMIQVVGIKRTVGVVTLIVMSDASAFEAHHAVGQPSPGMSLTEFASTLKTAVKPKKGQGRKGK